MDNAGHIKLYRGILDSQVFAHPTALKIWVWCLLKASYKDRFVTLKVGKGDTIVKISSGQFIFGRMKAEEELGIDGSTIYKWMQKFASEAFECMISLDSNSQYTIITINKWSEYQSIDTQEVTTKEQPSDNQVTALEQPSDSVVTQTIHYKNSKESKLNKDISLESDVYSFDEFWNDYDKKVGEKGKIERKFKALTDKDKLNIKEHIPKYKRSQPDKQFRKNPETYLNNKSWNDEIIMPQEKYPEKGKTLTTFDEKSFKQLN